MSTSVKQLLDTFDRLPDADKREMAAEIMRRTVKLDLSPLADEYLVLNAEDLFLELDKRESLAIGL
ncbi:MAG: hypothetical protein PHV74_01625 [Dehalococcoidia bacterium]|nr:hypothetical protein [Dehalococcoidia bacterium]